MNVESFVFYFFSAVLVASALAVITVKNPVHAALFLVLSFFSAAGIWVLLEAEFLAITLVLVYVGAVMVLFLFVVMMLDFDLKKLRKGFWKWIPFGALLTVLMVVEMWMVLGGERFGLRGIAIPASHPAGYSNTKELGRLIYSFYVYAFELAAVILLVAIVAAIALTLRRRRDSRKQNVAEQVSVRRENRVRMVSMATGKKGE